MAAVKKASFASRQNRAGPAPLASFEDLPSDELESPNSSREDADSISSPPRMMRDGITPETFNIIFSEEDSTPGTVMCSPLSILQIDITQDNDNESQRTLTPCDALEEEESLPRKDSKDSTVSLASTLKKLEVGPQYPESALLPSPDSLSVAPDASLTTPNDGSQRKGSWTDIFRSRSRSRSHSPQPSPQSPRKAPPELPLEEISKEIPAETAKKQKKGILSIFKFHDKKSHKSSKSPVNPESPSGGIFPNSAPPASPTSVLPVGNQGLELETPQPATVASENKVEMVNDTTMAVKIKEHSNTTQVEVETLQETFESEDSSQHIELRARLSSERTSRSLDHEPLSGRKEDEFKGSSESELAPETPVEVKVEELEEEEIDFEAETLLTQDSIDYEESSECTTLEVFQTQSKTLPRRQRLEITTVPIERPRSTTPISVAPFEAFIQSAQQQVPLPESGLEKIKVLLPGEQFTARLKSPKKGSQKSWQDFCHSGLHSPRATKRPQREAFENDLSPPTPNFSDSPFGNEVDWVAETPPFGESKWETFDTSKNLENPDEQQTSLSSSNFSKDSFTLNFNCLPLDRKSVCSNNDPILAAGAQQQVKVKIEQNDWSSSSSSNSSQ